MYIEFHDRQAVMFTAPNCLRPVEQQQQQLTLNRCFFKGQLRTYLHQTLMTMTQKKNVFFEMQKLVQLHYAFGIYICRRM